MTVSENNDQPERQIDQQGSAGQAQMVLPGFPAGFTPSMQVQFSAYQVTVQPGKAMTVKEVALSR